MRIDREEKAARAEALFREGYNCAQSVVLAYTEEMGLEMKTAARLSSGFGGGVGGLRGICGAVSGMAMVYGMLCGYDRPEEKAGKKAEYAAIQRMANRFREAEEAIDCRPLLERAGIDPSNMPSERDPEYYAKRPCRAWCGKPLRFWLTSSVRKALARRPKPRQGPETPVPPP